MARIGRTMQQVTSINRERVDVFAPERPGLLVIYFNPAKAADDNLIRYMTARFGVENVAVRKRALVDYLLVILTDWNMIHAGTGPTTIIEVPCPVCETTGKLEYEPEQEVPVDPADPSKGTVKVAAQFEDCFHCYGAGMVPADPVPAQPEQLQQAQQPPLTDAEADALLAQGYVEVDAGTENTGPPTGPLGETVDDAVAAQLPPVQIGDPLPINRANLNALGIYYLAQVVRAITAKFQVGNSDSAASSSAS